MWLHRLLNVSGLPLLLLTLLLNGCMPKKEPATETMLLVPAGEFIMGSNRKDTHGKTAEFGMAKPLFLDEHPERRVFLPAFYIDRYEVTNDQYYEYVLATRSRPPAYWVNGAIPPGRGSYPVTDVNWYEADRYCRWRGDRLPSEAQWEKAARGPAGQEFPWGNEYDSRKVNAGDSGRRDLAPVGSYEAGRSPYGAYDMAGNVWEWTQDWYQPYPGSDYHSDAFGEKFKILRGSSFGGIGHYALADFYRGAHRFFAAPEQRFSDAGIRCARNVPRLPLTSLFGHKK